jgi:hypothetical protein
MIKTARDRERERGGGGEKVKRQGIVRDAFILLTYLLTPWSRVLLEKLTSKLCS